MIRRPFALMLAAAALGGLQAPPAPGLATLGVQAEQSKKAIHTEKVSRRAVRQQLVSYGLFSDVGGRAPWVNKHGYLLRQVARPMPRSTR